MLRFYSDCILLVGPPARREAKVRPRFVSTRDPDFGHAVHAPPLTFTPL
jgi:hypothetical protein